MLYAYGMKIGAKLMARGKLGPALRLLVRPVNYWRNIEYRLICDAANFTAEDRVLDIGSPKLLSFYLAKVVGADVVATDIDDYFIDNERLIGEIEGIPSQKLRTAVEDGRRLSFPDDSFDKVYSLSVLEHIPEGGDTDCIKEIGRVLTPGGRCYLTVPFWPESRVDYIKDKGVYWTEHSVDAGDGRVFYQRRYSEQDLYDRLISPSGMKLRQLSYVGERVMKGSQRELSDFLPAITGPVQPLLSWLLHTPPTDSWKTLDKPLCALVVLEKQNS